MLLRERVALLGEFVCALPAGPGVRGAREQLLALLFEPADIAGELVAAGLALGSVPPLAPLAEPGLVGLDGRDRVLNLGVSLDVVGGERAELRVHGVDLPLELAHPHDARGGHRFAGVRFALSVARDAGVSDLFEGEVLVVALAHPGGHPLDRPVLVRDVRGRGDRSAVSLGLGRLVDEQDRGGFSGA